MCFGAGLCSLGMATAPFSNGELLRGSEVKFTRGLTTGPLVSGSWEVVEEDLVGAGL